MSVKSIYVCEGSSLENYNVKTPTAVLTGLYYVPGEFNNTAARHGLLKEARNRKQHPLWL